MANACFRPIELRPSTADIGAAAEGQLWTRLQPKADIPLSAPYRTFRHALGKSAPGALPSIGHGS